MNPPLFRCRRRRLSRKRSQRPAFRPHLAPRAEIAIEVYPLDATEALLARLRAMGTTRISLGIETLHAAMLKRLGRRYTPDEALDAINASLS